MTATPGLCSNCEHQRRIQSARGSLFILCEAALADSRYPKYPHLPVLRCTPYLPTLPTTEHRSV